MPDLPAACSSMIIKKNTVFVNSVRSSQWQSALMWLWALGAGYQERDGLTLLIGKCVFNHWSLMGDEEEKYFQLGISSCCN